MDRTSLISSEVKSHRLASKIDGVGERSKGDKDDNRDAVNRDEAAAAAGRDMDKDKRLHGSLEEELLQRDRLINDIQGFRRDEEIFDQNMEDLEVWGYERRRLVTSELKELCCRFKYLRGDIKATISEVEDKGTHAASLEKRYDW